MNNNEWCDYDEWLAHLEADGVPASIFDRLLQGVLYVANSCEIDVMALSAVAYDGYRHAHRDIPLASSAVIRKWLNTNRWEPLIQQLAKTHAARNHHAASVCQ
jgi:hypothetical protein